MFEQTFVKTGRTSRPWTIVVSLVLQVGLVGVMVLLPLIYTDTLPGAQLRNPLVAPSPPAAPPPPAVKIVAVERVKAIPRQFVSPERFYAPRSIPATTPVIIDEDMPSVVPEEIGSRIPGAIPCGQPGLPPCGSTGSGVPWATGPTIPPPPPPMEKKEEAAKPTVPERILVGGNVQQAKLIRQPKPVYPPLARQARVQGAVRLNAIIGRDGAIQNLQVTSGHPLLVPAAIEAVRQWVYQPTFLNGEPVEVVTVIEVNFTLTR